MMLGQRQCTAPQPCGGQLLYYTSFIPPTWRQPNGRKPVRGKQGHSVPGAFSVSRAENSLFCGADQCSGWVVKWWERRFLLGSVCRRSWRDLGLILKSLYQSQSCVTHAWVQAIKWGHPSAFVDKHQNPFDLQAICESTLCSLSRYGIENPLDSVMCYADLLYKVCSMFQGVHITVVPYQSIRHLLSVCFKSHKYRANFKCKFCSCKVSISNLIQKVLTFSEMYLLYNVMI